MSDHLRRWLGTCQIDVRRWLQRRRGDLAWLVIEAVVATLIARLMTLR